MGVKSKVFDPDSIKPAIAQALQAYKDEIRLLFDRYTLRDTGNLINSGETKDTDAGFEISYGADYAEFVYHKDGIEPTTPGTSSYWDDKAVESAEFAKILEKVSKKASDLLNKK